MAQNSNFFSNDERRTDTRAQAIDCRAADYYINIDGTQSRDNFCGIIKLWQGEVSGFLNEIYIGFFEAHKIFRILYLT